MNRVVLQIVIVALVLGISFGLVALLVSLRQENEPIAPDVPPPLVRATVVTLEEYAMTLESQGTVLARTESDLVPEVSGRVVEVSECLVAGGFFRRGEVLFRIDERDYELAVVQASAEVARFRRALAQEKAEAMIASREWEELGGGEGNQLVTREFHVKEAEAQLKSAEAHLARAELDLERTKVIAPYDGRVRTESIDVGQFVNRGTAIAQLYAIDYAEVRLPFSDSEVTFLDLPLHYRGEREAPPGPEVTLSATFGKETYTWRGRIVRTEGEIDVRSRMIHAVARVEDPYGRGDDPDRPPLAVGLFVEAKVEGRAFRDVAVLPRSVLYRGDSLLVIDDESRIRVREVDVLRATRDIVMIGGGVEEGVRVCLTALEVVSDGMQVRVALEENEASPSGGIER